MKKSGISLIAVLMFMLAATTASIVVFKWIGSENFSSGSRLKQSEAYQASESGLAAVQAWLVNRAPDVGALVNAYIDNGGKSIQMTDLLGKMSNSRQQNYKVYLTGLDARAPMKLKFMSIGTGRNGSEVKQTAIFSVDGLYRVVVQPGTINEDCEVKFNQAFFGGIENNTQAKWSSAIVNGDLKIGNGITLNNKLIVTGNVSGDAAINSCDSNNVDTADVYIVGDVNTTRLNVCGSLYVGGIIGGNKISGDNWEIKKDLYVVGGIKKVQSNDNQPRIVAGGNLTSCGDIVFSGTIDKFDINGNMVMDTCAHLQPIPKPKIAPTLSFINSATFNSPVLLGKKKFWSIGAITGTTSCGNLNIGSEGMYCEICTIVDGVSGCKKTDNVLFKTKEISPNNYKPTSADELKGMSNKIDFTLNPPRVPDPLELPEDTKKEWTRLAKKLLDSANAKDVENVPVSELPEDCIYLLRNNGNYKKDKNYYCKSEFGGGNSCGSNIALRLNQCYTKLKLQDCPTTGNAVPKYMYRGSDDLSKECYLPMQVFVSSDVGEVDGNFIWIFKPKPSTLKLPQTTNTSKVFVYLPEGAGKWEADKQGNYFIFADKNIDSASGNATINGTVFLANGARIGKLPDSELKFNKDLFDALIKAGILAEKGGGVDEFGNPKGCKSYGGANDDKWIPISSRLIATLENKQISTETEPLEASRISLGRSVLVMPRMVRITKDELPQKGDFSKYYSFMYLNGATESDKPSNAPTCSPIGGTKGNFNQSGANAEGLYKCEFASDITSNFYVKVAGVQGAPKVWIEPTTAEVSGTNDCKIVKLVTEKQGTASITITKSMGNNWNVTQKYPCSLNLCAITFGSSLSVELFQVCPPSSPPDNFIQYTISTEQGESTYRIDPDANTSAIKIRRDIGYIERQEAASGDWEQCPDGKKPANWATVECTDGAVIKTANKKWECMAGSTSTATWRVSGGDACCPIASGNECDNQPEISGGLSVSKDDAVSFTASLKWKAYDLYLQVPAGTNLPTVSSESPAPAINYTSSGCQKCLYHGAKYTVTNTDTENATNTGAYMYCVSNNTSLSNCDQTNATGVVDPGESFTVTATANTKVILAGPIQKNVTCQLYKTTILPGAQRLEKTDVIVTGCDKANSNFVINQPSQYTAGMTVPITITTENCQKNMTIDCGGITVVSCEYEASFCGGKPFADVKDDIAPAGSNSPTFSSANGDKGMRALIDSGGCVFIRDFENIQPSLNSTVSINGVDNACGCSWSGLAVANDNSQCNQVNVGCPYNTKPSSKDGGYYVYAKERGTGQTATINVYTNKSPNPAGTNVSSYYANYNETNGWQKVVYGTKNSACSGASNPPNSLACYDLPATGTAGQSINPPTVYCGSTQLTSGLTWNNAPTWSSPTANTYSNVSVTATCGGSSKTVTCGTLVVSSGTPTITCTHSTNNGCTVASNGVATCYMGNTSGNANAVVSRPTVTCSGAAAAGSSFYLVNNPNNKGWDNNVSTHTFYSEGDKQVTLSSVTCGSTSYTTGLPSCPDIKILAAGSSSNITLSTTDKDLIYGNTYTVTCNDLNKDIVCLNACSNMQVCYKYNRGSQNCIDGNNTVFSIINGKLNSEFDQKCINNATIEIMSSPTCSIKCKNSNTYY
ncbi:hypothetical protein R83H12_01519 [Fibrobacteria bacterium R8-3-H12]